MTAARIIVPGATTAVTKRTNLRKAFLGPWHQLVPQIWLYALADAQRHCTVAVHHGIAVINHHHLTVTPAKNNLPEFARRLHADVSSALNTLLVRERYEAPRQLFDEQQPHFMRLLDAPAQASHLIYERLNCVAAGLVDRPEHMPGYLFDFALWKRGFIEVERPPIYFANSRPDRLRLEVTPPPLLYRAFGGDLDALVYHMNRLGEDGIRALRATRKAPVRGARRVRRIHPWDEPRSLRESGGQPVPTFRVGARGIVGQLTNIAAATETHGFRVEHTESRIARLGGDLEREFPYGTYQWSVQHGAPVAPPIDGAILAQPGPLLCDVKLELERDRALRAELRERCGGLVAEVREAFGEEAEEIAAHTGLALSESVAVRVCTNDASEEASDEPRVAAVIVRHRFDKQLEVGSDSAARVVVLRDRRRGRPARTPGKHGADPPR